MPAIAHTGWSLSVVTPRNCRDPGRGITSVIDDLLDGLPLSKQPKDMPVAGRYRVASPAVARLQLGRVQVGCQPKSSHKICPSLDVVAFRHGLNSPAWVKHP